MSPPVNLRIIYHKVYQRKRRSSGQKLKLAEKATELAKIVLEKRTLKSINDLRIVENKWIALSSSGAKSMASEFERAIRSGNYCVEDPPISNSRFGFNPEVGVVYAFKCSEYGKLIKIGVTKGSILEAKARISTYASRYKLSDIRILMIFEARNPAKIEESLHEEFAANRTSVYGSKSNEWFNITQRSLRNAKDKYTNQAKLKKLTD